MDNIEEKVLRFLQNKSTTDEKEEVINFLKQTDDEPEVRKVLDSIWQHNDIQIKKGVIDLSRVLDQVHLRINPSATLSARSENKVFLLKALNIASKVAAILFLPLLIASVWMFTHDAKMNTAKNAKWVEIATTMGAKTNLALPDGSKVWLNDASKLKYPTQFHGDYREVYLEGEAFFEIVKNKELPFLVKTRSAITKVTGTSFNIRAYPDDNVFEATLNTGIIELEISHGVNPAQTIPMKPREQISLNTQTGKIENKTVDAETFNSWINGKLLFRDTPMNEALRKLERWYNADIKLASPELKDILITATFQEEKLSQALDLLSFATPIKYHISNRERKEDGTYKKQTIIISKR